MDKIERLLREGLALIDTAELACACGTRQVCSAAKYGPAITTIEPTATGFTLSNGEYATAVPRCPLCGEDIRGGLKRCTSRAKQAAGPTVKS